MSEIFFATIKDFWLSSNNWTELESTTVGKIILHYFESKSEVYGIFLEWLATIDEEKTLLYDDACHLLPHIKKLEKVPENELN